MNALARTRSPRPSLVAAAIAAVAIALGAPSAARAAERPVGAETLHEKALAAMAEQRYAEAAELFHAAFSLDPAPELLWNEARARHLAGELERARDLYKEFIERDDAPAALRGRANDAIVEITLELDKQKIVPPAPETPEPMDDTLGTVLVIGGAVVVAGGAVAHIVSFAAADDMQTYAQPSATLSDEERLSRFRDAESDRDMFQALAIAGYALGGAVLVGGIVSLVLTDDPEPVALVPFGGAGQVGLAASWRF